ncbi:MAG: hypothetical protein R3C59_16360 [Planctomycetaceae bacterium]
MLEPDNNGGHPRREARFASTQWSVVLRAGGETDESRHALSQLIQTYWYPIYSFSRRSGNNHHDAMDLTQGFFSHLLNGSGLANVSPLHGRFRSFLIASFRNYKSNERRASEAQRRGGAVQHFSLNSPEAELRFDNEPVEEGTPESIFERRWAESLLAWVLERLAQEYREADKSELFRLLEPHLTFSDDAIPRSDISSQLNLSVAAIAMSIHRMRRRYAEILRDEVSATVAGPDDVDDEIRTLMSVVKATR